MRILALETTEPIGSVAALDDGKLLAELELNPQQRSARSLAPGLRRLLGQLGWRPQDIDLVAVTVGPGSFTGLRVGVTTAKTLAYATGAAILGVDTLQAVASRAPAEVEALSVAVDAHRGEVVAQSFQRDPQRRLRAAGDAELLPIDAWLAAVPPGTVLSGPVLAKLAARVPDRLAVLDRQYWRPTAAAVAYLAAESYAAGRRDDLWSLVPRYYRRSAAEEKRDKGDC